MSDENSISRRGIREMSYGTAPAAPSRSSEATPSGDAVVPSRTENRWSLLRNRVRNRPFRSNRPTLPVPPSNGVFQSVFARGVGSSRLSASKPSARLTEYDSADETTALIPPRSDIEHDPSLMNIAPKRPRKSFVYRMLNPNSHSLPARVFRVVLTFLIFLSILSFVVGTVPAAAAAAPSVFLGIEGFCSSAFLIEYVLRIVTIGESKQYAGWNPVLLRLRWAVKFSSLIDFAAFASFFLELAFQKELPNLQVLRILRIFRVLKSNRFASSMEAAHRVLYYNFEILIVAFCICLVLILLTSSALYFLHPRVDAPAPASLAAAADSSYLGDDSLQSGRTNAFTSSVIVPVPPFAHYHAVPYAPEPQRHTSGSSQPFVYAASPPHCSCSCTCSDGTGEWEARGRLLETFTSRSFKSSLSAEKRPPEFESMFDTIYLSIMMLTGQGMPDGVLPWYTKVVVAATCIFSIALFAIPASMLTWGFEAEAQRLAIKRAKAAMRRRSRRRQGLTAESNATSSTESSSDYKSEGSEWEEYERVLVTDSDDSADVVPAPAAVSVAT